MHARHGAGCSTWQRSPPSKTAGTLGSFSVDFRSSRPGGASLLSSDGAGETRADDFASRKRSMVHNPGNLCVRCVCRLCVGSALTKGHLTTRNEIFKTHALWIWGYEIVSALARGGSLRWMAWTDSSLACRWSEREEGLAESALSVLGCR
jgi:hypothetical protein